MSPPPRHAWNLSPKEAVSIQNRLARRVVEKNRVGRIRYVAGADVALERHSRFGYAGVVLLTYPELAVVEKVSARVPIHFPYVPGLLAFREVPALLEAFARLRRPPDLILIDGQGIAHPRRCGIASHIGILLGKPTIGCAKSRLCGHHREPARRRGSLRSLYADDGSVIGTVVRTRDDTRPLYVSIGHMIDLPTAVRFTLACGRGYRIPEPTRLADQYVRELKRKQS